MALPQPIHIKSRNTGFYVVSAVNDKVNQQVDTRDGKDTIPKDAVLLIQPWIYGPVTVSAITGISGLYVALEGTAENTKLTWSDKEYKWIIRAVGAGSPIYYLNPANGADLYWFDEFSSQIGNHVEVRAGKDIKPPQAEWVISRF